MSRTRVRIAVAHFVAAVAVLGCHLSDPSTTPQQSYRSTRGLIPDTTWKDREVHRVWVSKWSGADGSYFQIDEGGWFEAYLALRPNDVKPFCPVVEGQLPAEVLNGGRQDYVKKGEWVDIVSEDNDQGYSLFPYVFRVRIDPKADDLWAYYDCGGEAKAFPMRRVVVGEKSSRAK